MPTGTLEQVKREMPPVPRLTEDDMKTTVYQVLQACNEDATYSDGCKIKVKKSKINGYAGEGVFATEDISKGEFITVYPVHFIILKEEKGKQIAHCEKLYDLKTDMTPLDRCKDFVMGLTEDFSIMGDPQQKNDLRLVGHKINDNGYDGTENYLGNEKANCVYYLLDIVACKDIEKGEELSIRYGCEYWYEPVSNDGGTRHSILKNIMDDYIVDGASTTDSD